MIVVKVILEVAITTVIILDVIKGIKNRVDTDQDDNPKDKIK